MTKKLKNILWLLVSVLAIFWLVRGMDRELVLNALGQADYRWLIFAVVLFTITQAFLSLRWVILLRANEITISIPQAIRLTFLGMFYNNFMPGSVGGDILKAWYATHHCPADRKIHAAMSVFFDRIFGLTGTLILGSIAAISLKDGFSLSLKGHEIDVKQIIIWFIVIISTSAIIIASKRIRRFLFISNLLKMLPFQKKLQEIEKGIRIYRNRPGYLALALMVTFCVQTLAITSVWLMTIALDLKGISLLHCITIMPIVWVISATLPVPGGLGVIENLMVPFFIAAADVTAFDSPEQLTARVMALTILNRIMIYLSSSFGGLVPIFGGHLPKQAEIANEIEV